MWRVPALAVTGTVTAARTRPVALTPSAGVEGVLEALAAVGVAAVEVVVAGVVAAGAEVSFSLCIGVVYVYPLPPSKLC